MNVVEIVTKGLEGIESSVNTFKQAARKEINEMKDSQREFADRLLGLEQKGSAWSVDSVSAGGASGSLGNKVWKSIQDNGDLLSKTDKLRIEIKAAGDVTRVSRILCKRDLG